MLLGLVVGLMLQAKVERLPIPADAAAVALADASANQASAPVWRYVWSHNGGKEALNDADVAVNLAMSRSSVLVRSARVGERMLRLDLRKLCPKPDDLALMIGLWERLAEDEPYFLVAAGQAVEVVPLKAFVVTNGGGCTLRSGEKVLAQIPGGTRLELVREFEANGANWFQVIFQGSEGVIASSAAKKEEVAQKPVKIATRVMGAHVGVEGQKLAEICQTAVPVVRADWFQRKVLTSLDGGLYPEFRGIGKAPQGSGLSDLDNFLRVFTGTTLEDVQRLRSDQKASMLKSRVTGKPRSVVIFGGIQGRVGVNQGLVALTHDPADGDANDPKSDPILNLLDAKYKAIEVIAELPQGLHAFALFSGDDGDGVFDPKKKEGEFQRSAPDDVVRDHTIPSPHTARLEGALGCLRCHATTLDGAEAQGWMPIRNDVQTLLKSRLDVFGSRADGFPNQDTIDRLAGLFSGDLRKPLQRGRDDLSEAVLRLTLETDDEKSGVVTRVHSRIARTHAELVYDDVTAQKALGELGFASADDVAATAILVKLLPPLPKDEIGVSVEDGRIGALKAGLAISRAQFEAVYPFMATRMIDALKVEVKK